MHIDVWTKKRFRLGLAWYTFEKQKLIKNHSVLCRFKCLCRPTQSHAEPNRSAVSIKLTKNINQL